MDDNKIVGFQEKPTHRYHINAGVYVLSPKVIQELPHGSPYDMPCLFTTLRKRGLQTVGYPIYEPWIDVGNPTDFQMAQVKNDAKA